MLLSFCIPVHNRTYDLRHTLPYIFAASKASPPVEILVLDYNSGDDLEEYAGAVGNKIVYRKYSGRGYYHMAHARNLSVLASSGEYFIIWSADLRPTMQFLPAVRECIETKHPLWMYPKGESEIIICQKEEFVSAGGYDERFEFYGPEGKELNARLTRRGGKFELLAVKPFEKLPTPDKEKIQNYRLHLSRRQMNSMMRAVYNEDMTKEILVANPEGWGSWT